MNARAAVGGAARRVALTLLAGSAIAGCHSTSAAPRAASCDQTNAAATVARGHQDAGFAVTATIEIRNRSGNTCSIHGTPAVRFANGDQPGTVNDTAIPRPHFAIDQNLRPGESVGFAVGWQGADGCQPNHVLPIKQVLVTLSRGATPLRAQPVLSPKLRLYCWVDQITTG